MMEIEMEKRIKQAIDDLVSDTACCDRFGCRCWQAVEDLKRIRDYCDGEICRAIHLTPAEKEKVG